MMMKDTGYVVECLIIMCDNKFVWVELTSIHTHRG